MIFIIKWSLSLFLNNIPIQNLPGWTAKKMTMRWSWSKRYLFIRNQQLWRKGEDIDLGIGRSETTMDLPADRGQADQKLLSKRGLSRCHTLNWNAWFLYSFSGQLFYVGCPGKGMDLSEGFLCQRGRLWRSWQIIRLSGNHTFHKLSGKFFFKRHLDSASSHLSKENFEFPLNNGHDSYVHTNIHNSTKEETTQMPINWWVDKYNMVYPSKGISLGNEKEFSADGCYNMEPWKHKPKSKKPVTKDHSRAVRTRWQSRRACAHVLLREHQNHS